MANKQDLDYEAVVTNDQGKALAAKLGVKFFQTSAKTGQGVNDAMTGLVTDIPRSGLDYKVIRELIRASNCTKTKIYLHYFILLKEVPLGNSLNLMSSHK